MLAKRTNILFDEKMWSFLQLEARKRKLSVSKLVRMAVGEAYLEDEDRQKVKKALDHIREIRKHSKGKIDYKSLIDYGRRY